VRLDLDVHVDQVEVTVRRVGDGEVAASGVEVDHLAKGQLATVVEVGAGELDVAERGRLEGSHPAHPVDVGPGSHLSRDVAGPVGEATVVQNLGGDVGRVEWPQRVHEPLDHRDVGEDVHHAADAAAGLVHLGREVAHGEVVREVADVSGNHGACRLALEARVDLRVLRRWLESALPGEGLDGGERGPGGGWLGEVFDGVVPAGVVVRTCQVLHHEGRKRQRPAEGVVAASPDVLGDGTNSEVVHPVVEKGLVGSGPGAEPGEPGRGCAGV